MGWRDNMALGAHPGNPEVPEETVWLNGEDQGRTLAEAPARKRVSRFRVDHVEAEERETLRQLAAMGEVGQLEVRALFADANKRELEAALDKARIVRAHPGVFPVAYEQERPWLLKVLMVVVVMMVVLQVIQLAGRPPTLPPQVDENGVGAPEGRLEVGQGKGKRAGDDVARPVGPGEEAPRGDGDRRRVRRVGAVGSVPTRAWAAANP